MRIAIVAGELSGDLLGGGLIEALRQRYPQAHFEGVGGPCMLAAGLQGLVPLERLSVMGLVEVLRHLPALLRIRSRLHRRWRETPPDLYIGIDAPDFNLPLARRLRRSGVPTVQYVSPSVWAWRQGRVRGIARSVDLMLTLFPFEAAFYREHRVPVVWVGHPLAEEIKAADDREAARAALGIEPAATLVGLLPGSRLGEVERLGPLFLGAARWLHARRPDLQFVLPCATPRLRERLETLLAALPVALPVHLVDGRSREAMSASDLLLLASGTVTLEAMLLRRPMVVAYRVAPLTAWIARRLVRTRHFAIPNLLAGARLVPEFIQDAATGDALGAELLTWLQDASRRERSMERFAELHASLRRGGSQRAAEAIADLLEPRTDGRINGEA